ncbi:uncharacterized protein YjbI with pentapeptide repeats [Actinokineospora baliensis]|uniref:pentapeptide repeat-containing protein n=1 Tax=Actinokineospora baliensis TaxID=547056 RepID=UPI00195E67FF|nr:pentapeptide repeat-containing protein [Actinokineospora baliensis]MBM7774369.1 uncharacterized protein YjbI with pentapeptide repeats [Actinokineospora baliensis]
MIRQRAVEVISALTALGAVVVAGLTLIATQDQVTAAQEQSKAALRQNEVAEQGQFTDRYTKAVEQLDRTGADHLQSRLGAVYALERLARDSPRDQPSVIEVLSAFVRTTSPRLAPAECPDLPPAADIQAALTVLGRRDTKFDQTTRIDLNSTCLRNIKLNNANLEYSDLRGADLYDAQLNDATLRHATLVGAALVGVDLRNSDLGSADLSQANLGNADFSYADLSNVGFRKANLSHATLENAELGLANFTNADLRGANLTAAVHDEMTQTGGALVDGATKGEWWR